ncbi:MAG: hypothetical protein AAF821_26625 [Cyanobacteria bacterium P01_D01_bin.156]
MGIDVVAFVFGAILFSIGLWGGGVSAKDISIPKIGVGPRVISSGMGLFMLLLGVGLTDLIHGFSNSEAVDSPQLPTAEPQPAVAVPPDEIVTDVPVGSQGSQPDEIVTDVPVGSQGSQPEDPDQAWKTQVGSQLIAATQQVGLNGYQLTHDPFLGKLEDNTRESIRITLEGGVSYGLIGVCDEDCGDIDLHLYDENDNLIDSDTQGDDYPVIQVQPEWTGPFSIVVEMPNCAAAYCYYGLGAYGQ